MEKMLVGLQNILKDNIRIETCDLSKVHLIAGVSISIWYDLDNAKESGACGIVVTDKTSGKIVDSAHYYQDKVEIPFVKDCTEFRELPLLLATLDKLSCVPDIYIVDRQGYMHPRHMGLASYASFYLKKPVIGVTKSISGFDYSIPLREDGAWAEIMIGDDVYGRVVRIAREYEPIFVSVGNHITLEQVTDLVCELKCDMSRMPSPVYLAEEVVDACRTGGLH